MSEPPTPAPELPIHDVQTPGALAGAEVCWMGVRSLALDTEFMRERTFYSRLALVQIADRDIAWLIDPLAPALAGDLSPVARLLADRGVVKVVHSASEDVDVLRRSFGDVPAPLFDTQIAAGIAGVGAGLSYGKLVQELLGVELHKGETRTDWLARPLTPAQRLYAAEDVLYLLPLFERLSAELERLGRLEWALEDAAAIGADARGEEEPELAWTRVKGSGRMTRRQLGVLKVLAEWREREARRRDLPRGFVLREEILVLLAARMPEKRQDLYRLPNVDQRQLARDGATWIELVRQGKAMPEEELPTPRPQPPFTPWAKELDKRLRAVVKARAEELGMPPEVLASRRGTDVLMRYGPAPIPPEETPRALRGWRREVIGERLLDEVRRGWVDEGW
jgi:ribonuclease D